MADSFKLKAAYQAVGEDSPRSPRASPRRSLLDWQPSAAWLPVAALCGALLTLAVVSLAGGGNLRWRGECQRGWDAAIGLQAGCQPPAAPPAACLPGRLA